MNKKYILLLSFMIFLFRFAAADSFADLLVQEKLDKQTIHELYTAQGNNVMGNQAKPSVIIVDFFDNNCPYCRIASRALKKRLAQDPRIQVVFKEYPVLGEDSELSAKAAHAAAKQNKYLPMHDAMMAHSDHLGLAEIKALAKTIDVDLKKLIADLEDDKISKQLERNAALAEQLSIQAVPAFVIAQANILTAQDPSKVPQYYWSGSLDDPRFTTLLRSIEK